jgi:hypothetical protein
VGCGYSSRAAANRFPNLKVAGFKLLAGSE